MTIVSHPANTPQLTALKKQLPQSLLLSGVVGIGLKTTAQQLAGSHLEGIIQPQNAKEELDQNGTISVDAIRRLYHQTRAKRTADHVIIIDDADRMSAGAQAAFLKLLEEPNEHTHFILTSHQPQKLLPTIRSRVQHISLQPINDIQTREYIKMLGVEDQTKRIQLTFIASGLPAELSRLVNDDDYFAARAAIITDARTLLQASSYDKLLVAQKYQSDRTNALQLVDSAMYIIRRSLAANPQPLLVQQLEGLLNIRENIAAQHNVRLQLASFVL